MTSEAANTPPSDNSSSKRDWRPGPLQIEGINWVTSTFLVTTLLISLTVPWFYIPRFGFGWFEFLLFLTMFAVGGLSITAGYHRLFSHRTYQAAWPLRLLSVLFGASTFQMSALAWSSEHRYHHKYTDHDGDPHDPHSIQRGFFWAHVGWLLVHVDPKSKDTNVDDLRRDPIVMWQHRLYIPIAIVMGFFLPMGAGAAWTWSQSGAWLPGLFAGFLWGGCVRVVVLHHFTFFINSWAHIMGRRPYDGDSSARDSAILAFFTFGEGYHNYHHAFQTDYRNGIKPWQFDPAKWMIWAASKVGLARNLRRVPKETIRLALLREERRKLENELENLDQPVLQTFREGLDQLEARLEELHLEFRQHLASYRKAKSRKIEQHRQRLAEVRREMREARREFDRCFRAWRRLHRLVSAYA